MRPSTLGAVVLAVAVLVPSIAGGHAERPTPSPARDGAVPNPNRIPTKTIDVCKTGDCDYEHIQAAVNAAPDGGLIQIWPGLYKEEPSRAAPSLEPDSPDGTYSYDHQLKHPNSQNLIAVVGKKNITLRGMGARPRDVLIDVEFKKHVGIRGDRADGLIIENLSMWHAFDHGIYVLDQSGYLIDRVVSGFSRDYSFLMFATDHGLIQNCEAFGAGDAGIYPGGEPNTPGRHSNEVTNCKSYHNVIGYSGTQGNYVWVHDNEFYDNAVAMTSDSETDHPNYPQQNLTVEGNKIHDNNFNVYAEDSDVFSVFGDGIYLPVGTGLFLPSGNLNLVQNNEVWGNDRYGIWLGAGQGMVVGPTSDPVGAPFISTGNRFIGNKMYGPSGKKNGTDFAWDGMGVNNCWEANVASAEGAPVTSDAPFLPPCNLPGNLGPMPFTVGAPYAVNMVHQAGILFVPQESPIGAGEPIACAVDIGGCVWGPGPRPGEARNTPEGYQPPPTPPTCGPSTPCTGASAARVRGTKTTRTFSVTASKLPATGVGTPAGIAMALLIGAAAIGASAIRGKFRRDPNR
jgi:hypothetical protein